MKRYLLFVLALLLAACGGDEVVLPTNTPDPLSFFAPTPISPGREQNPLRLVFVPPDPEAEQLDAAAQALQNELSTRSGLAIEVVLADSHGEALTLLCDYNDEDRYAAPWLSGPTAVIALRRGCGEVALQALRGGSTGLSGEIVGLPNSGVSVIEGRTFCRLDVGDFYSWVLPTLALQTRGITTTELGAVDDYPSYEFMFQAITEGDCIATGAPAGLLQTEEFADVVDELGVSYITPPMPYGVLLYPPELLLADRAALSEAYLEIAMPADAAAATEEAPANPNATPVAGIVALDESSLTPMQQAMLLLLGAEGVTEATPDALTEVRTFMDDTGLNLAEDTR